MTPTKQLWEEEFAIVLGTQGAYRAGDVRGMTPEKRTWVLRRLRRWAEAAGRGPRGRRR